MPTTLHIEHPITDFGTGKAALDRVGPIRVQSGVLHHRVHRPVDEPNYVVVGLDFGTTAQAESFFAFLENRIWSTPTSRRPFPANPGRRSSSTSRRGDAAVDGPGHPRRRGMPRRPMRADGGTMLNPLGTAAVIAQEAIHRVSVSGPSQLEFLREVASRVASVVPYDAGAWLVTDPATLLQTGAFIQGPQPISEQTHLRFADNELLTPDFAKITEMARGLQPVVTLQEATDGDLSHSARHRTIHADLGVGHELRAVFRTSDTTWGAVCMCRTIGQANFTEAEQGFMAAVSRHIGDGLRLALLLSSATATEVHSIPGVIVLGPDDTVESATPEAEVWLAQISRDEGAAFELPSVVHHAARQARAIAGGTASGPAFSRLRLRSGQWLLVRATQPHRPDGRNDSTAIVLEPARAAELAPMIVGLYELTPRERHVTELLLRGLPIDEIGSALWISRHTVRDHTKAIFAKLAVGSRPELMAKLFNDHYLQAMTYEQQLTPVT